MLSTTLQAPSIDLVTVPAGEFIMGRLEGYPHGGREDPAHKIKLATYQIGRYPVTNAQYRVFALDTGHKFTDGPDDHPVSGLKWQDAWLFCAWLRYKTGQPYHLPSEAEWEKAATWNPQTKQKQPYPWGYAPTDKYCNILSSGPKRTTPVGYYSPEGDSPYGCADMIGNVDEWCNTAVREYPYDPSDGCEELNAEGRRALRGGDWYTSSPPSGIRRNMPSDAWVGLWGFRVALGASLDQAHCLFQQKLGQWWQQTNAEYQQKIKQEPRNPQVWYNLGAWTINLHSAGIQNFAQAENALTQTLALALQPLSKSKLASPLAWVYYNRAYARFELQHYPEALADIVEALKLDTTDADAHILHAQILCKCQEWKKAREAWAKALRINPQHPLKFILQAQLHVGLKEYQQALQTLTEIIERPLFHPLPRPEMHLLRAEVYEQIGATEKALSDYCHYLLWKPNAPEATSLRVKFVKELERA